MCKFPIFLPFIISFVYHYVQVLLSFYLSLYVQCPIMCKFSFFLHSIISLVSHFGQVPYLFTFHQIFSVPLCASSPSFYIPLYLQCPILGKYPIALRFIISSVSHYVSVLHIFTFHFVFSVQLCGSSQTSYVSLYIQCPVMCKFPTFVTFHYIFNGLIIASTLSLRLIISFACHYVQVPYLFTFHQIFSVPLCASSPFFSISLYLQCPILGKFPIYLHSIRSSVSHCGQVPNNFVLHYIFSVPLCASSLSFYLSLFPLCTIMCKFSFFLPFIICSVSHFGQVPYLFTFHQIFSVPFWASSLPIYISLYLQCPIMCKFPIYLHSIRSSVSHFGQVPYLFTFHYIFSFPLCASSLTSYVSLYLQCPILGKYPIVLRFIISSVSHYVQVLHIFKFHSIFSVPFCASSLFLCFVISSVSHSGQVPNNFVLHYIFSVPLCASSLLLLHFIIFLMVSLLASSLSLRLIISFACHYVQVPYLFTLHYIFSVPFWASSLSIYISLDLQCPIVGKYPIILCFIIYLVSHYVQVPYLFTFHQIFSVPLCASSPFFSISLHLQYPILGKFPIYLHSIRSSVSHFGQVPYLFTFHYIFSVPFWASTLQLYVSLYLQCPIMCKFSIFLHFILYLVSIMWKFSNFLCFLIYLVSCYVQVPYFCYISLYF